MSSEKQNTPQWAQERLAEPGYEWRVQSSSDGPRGRPRQSRRRGGHGGGAGTRYWAILASLAVVTVGLGAYLLGTQIGGQDALDAEGPSSDDQASGAEDDGTVTGFSLPDPSTLPQGEPEDRMSILVETPAPEVADGVQAATATIRSDGLLYFEGAFRSQQEADLHVERAADVFGPDAIVASYTIDPDAPPPAAANVALDKPVLFETGSAEIHPDYIPFLEACEGVLKANPDIKMSVCGLHRFGWSCRVQSRALAGTSGGHCRLLRLKRNRGRSTYRYGIR